MYRLITESANKIERPLNPRSNANVFEIITFSWILNLFQRGRKRDLEENDLYSTLNDHSSSLLGNKLEEKWRLEVACARKINRSPSLLRALIGLFGPKYLSYGLLQLTSEIIKSFLQIALTELEASENYTLIRKNNSFKHMYASKKTNLLTL